MPHHCVGHFIDRALEAWQSKLQLNGRQAMFNHERMEELLDGCARSILGRQQYTQGRWKEMEPPIREMLFTVRDEKALAQGIPKTFAVCVEWSEPRQLLMFSISTPLLSAELEDDAWDLIDALSLNRERRSVLELSAEEEFPVLVRRVECDLAGLSTEDISFDERAIPRLQEAFRTICREHLDDMLLFQGITFGDVHSQLHVH